MGSVTSSSTLFSGRTGIVRIDHSLLYREFRIFQTSESAVGEHAPEGHKKHKKPA